MWVILKTLLNNHGLTYRSDFWGYHEPIRQFMPQNCSADIQAVIAHLDSVFSENDPSQVEQVLSLFGLEALAPHVDDVASACTYLSYPLKIPSLLMRTFSVIVSNNLGLWQGQQPSSGPGGDFFQFCDALEIKDGESAPAGGLGLDDALQAWELY